MLIAAASAAVSSGSVSATPVVAVAVALIAMAVVAVFACSFVLHRRSGRQQRRSGRSAVSPR
jgi:hypothetical protein